MSVITCDNGILRELITPVSEKFFMTIVGMMPGSNYITSVTPASGVVSYKSNLMDGSNRIGGNGPLKIRYITQETQNGNYKISEADYNLKQSNSFSSYKVGWGIQLPYPLTRVCIIPRESSHKHYNHYTAIDCKKSGLTSETGLIENNGATIWSSNASTRYVIATVNVDFSIGTIFVNNFKYDKTGYSWEDLKYILFAWGE